MDRTGSLTGRLAGAPISWGVCEVPGWGPQLPVDLVLAEMATVGLSASEFGPNGFLPTSGPAKARVLAEHGLRAVGGFVPVVAHREDLDPVHGLAAVFDDFLAAGADTVVFAAVSGVDGYEERVELDATAWRTLCRNLDRLADAAGARGLTAGLHPHVGTLVERPQDVAIVLDGARIGLCLDTGHVLVGGGDPLSLARTAADRVVHVHLKDVDVAVAARVRAGVLGYAEAVAGGLYRPLGRGDVGIAAIVALLEAAGYGGWYVLEQDRVLTPDRAGSAGALAAVRADVAASLAHLTAAVEPAAHRRPADKRPMETAVQARIGAA
jgi:inosose dehydratase